MKMCGNDGCNENENGVCWSGGCDDWMPSRWATYDNDNENENERNDDDEE